MLRYGTEDRLLPQGVEFDLEGAAFPELQLNAIRDFVAVDFRVGGVITTRDGPWETKFGFYHVCSHLGDQYMLENPDVGRVNFSRDCVILGVGYHPIPDVRLYGKVAYGVYVWGRSRAVGFQFGVEYAPGLPTGIEGAAPLRGDQRPFAARGQFRRRAHRASRLGLAGRSGHLFRMGLEYFNGKSEEYQFTDMYTQQIGAGMWYDF